MPASGAAFDVEFKRSRKSPAQSYGTTAVRVRTTSSKVYGLTSGRLAAPPKKARAKSSNERLPWLSRAIVAAPPVGPAASLKHPRRAGGGIQQRPPGAPGSSWPQAGGGARQRDPIA